MLGSHNTLTAYPCPWYLKPLNLFCKCQSKTIEEQLDAGVRFFDIRIKMKPDGRYCFAHGLAKYKCGSLACVLDALKRYARERECKVFFRALLEYGKEPRRYDEIRENLTDLLMGAYLVRSDTAGLCFCGAYAKWNYEEIMKPNADMPITHKYSSCIGWKRFIHCIPYLYARRHNKEFKERYKAVLESDRGVLLLDFI